MLRKLFAREDKTIDQGRVEKRGYNPMPAGWKPPAKIHPVHEAGRPPRSRRTEDRPENPPPADSGE